MLAARSLDPGVSNRGDVFSFDGAISSLTEEQDVEFEWAWIAPSGRPQTVQWTATVTETVVDGDDTIR